MSDNSFIQACIEGKALWTEIDDYVEKWHNSNTGQKLYEYLGLTEDEYKLWIEKSNAIKLIIAARKQNINILEFIAEERFAARAASKDETTNIRNWLIQTGRINNVV